MRFLSAYENLPVFFRNVSDEIGRSFYHSMTLHMEAVRVRRHCVAI